MPDQSTAVWDVVAIIVALCALYLTIRSDRATQEHNKLSVRPRLTTSTSRDPVALGQYPVTALQVRMTLTNVGLGPAIIKTAEVLLDGNVVAVETADDIRPLFERTFPEMLLGPLVTFMKLNKEHAIAVGEVVEVVQVQMLNPTANVKKELERFHLRIRYESMYHEPFVYDSRDHRST